MAIAKQDVRLVAEALARRIVAKNEDPATWKTALRVEVQRMGLDLINIDFDGCMRDAARSVVEEAVKHQRTAVDVNP